ncbi:MAG: cyclic nucleotide-binding domain-containing protein [Anaerolineales bacterium]|nr:cyclic nucleotide-binding domain-containing protein [Anaerolineales bacterium]
MIENNQRAAFLDKMHLFSGLDLTQLGVIGTRLVEKEVSAGTVIIKRGDKADGFYMIYKGKAKVTAPGPENKDKQLAILYPGDYFGEEALFENRNRVANVIASEHCTLLFISREGFEVLLSQYEKLRPNFQVSIKSRKLARSTNFKWLGKNEVIYFIARRHKIRLYQALVGPVFFMFIPIALFAAGIISQATTPYALGLIALIGGLGWGLWQIIDWSNDYYIVTNQRVIWLEKIIFLYDSREEAPLGTILSVGVESDALGRILNYGNVIVRTFVGKLEFDHVDHPVQAADMIREYWERTKAITTRSQMDVMKDTIKQKLGMPLEKRPQVELTPVVQLDEEKAAKTPLWMLALQKLFQLRIEEGGKVIYHKHWVILVQQGWQPLASFFATIAFIIWRIVRLASSPDLSLIRVNDAGTYSPDTIVVTALILLLPISAWLWYEYEDWKNDIFMVTNDEIFDIDRKPFGKEERRSAQIENILSTSYSRDGIIPIIFNYGTVKISVGGTQMGFEDVMDPASVQADINRRRAARIAKKNEDAGKDDRERFATWLAAYHQNIDEFASPAKPAPASANPNSTDPFAGEKKDLDDMPLGEEEDQDAEDQMGYGGGNETGGDL